MHRLRGSPIEWQEAEQELLLHLPPRGGRMVRPLLGSALVFAAMLLVVIYASDGWLPAVIGTPIDDPMTADLMAYLENAGYMQLYYDQFLPPELGELHKDTTQAIFGGTMTPLEAARAMEAKAKELLD